MCGADTTAGTCAVTAVDGRGANCILDGIKDPGQHTQNFFGALFDTTVTIDLKRNYRIVEVRVWGFEGGIGVDNIIVSTSDTSNSQSTTSCSSGVQHVCNAPLTQQTYQSTFCNADTWGRYLCMLRTGFTGMRVKEVQIYAYVCPPCYANQYRSTLLECMYCPAHSHLAADNIELTCICDAGFSHDSEGICNFDPVLPASTGTC